MNDRYEVKQFSDGELFLCFASTGRTEAECLAEIQERSPAQLETQVIRLGRLERRVLLYP